MRHYLRKPLFVALPLLGLLGLTGCSAVLPADLDGKLVSNWSADDHMAAAILYQNKGHQLEAEAVQYETAASRIGLHEDPKGFRRGAFAIAAQENRNAVKQMQERHAAHLEKAQTMYGKKNLE